MLLSSIYNNKFKHIHFIGIGGISMSGLAEILISEGYEVSGSDEKYSPIIERLESKGARVYIGHNKENITNADLIIYTDAISNDNEELLEANKRKIETINRGNFLGQLMKVYDKSVGISGTHGKSTTTGMLSVILNNSSINPTILLGGVLDDLEGTVKIGDNSCLVTEACEYKANILKFHPSIGIILNIEEDHLDYYRDLNHIIDTFTDFTKNIPKDGFLVINNDDDNCKSVINNSNCDVVTFGIKNNSDYLAKDITFTKEGFPKYKLLVNDHEYSVELKVMGVHNVYNSLAAIVTAHKCGVPLKEAIDNLKYYNGTHRRLEYKGSINNIKIIDDYAHHPTAIKSTLESIKKISPKKVWCVFQPHTYTRTKSLLEEFSNSFSKADKVIIPDIYPAREKDTGLIHSVDLVDKLKKKNVDTIYIKDFDEISSYLLNNCSDGDVVITMGAGDVYKIGDQLIKINKVSA
ncbi:UDP-N-acetylmuramate--L-alanine ligase [Dethiothermospora halolimnae]|uniref:UDP-N-acetylmuramate--L-alanine ligase n=1 Tax=Dethiothermospora halolimnae TaxID=3114390 RepID=UPI003CCB9233